MRIRVVFFGILKDLAQQSPSELDLPAGSTVGDLWSKVRELAPPVQRYERSVAIAVNHEFADSARTLAEGDEVGFLPPVSGGAPEPTEGTVRLPLDAVHARLQTEPLDAAQIMQKIKSGNDGSVLLFDGTVRNQTRGRKTLYLDYDSYPKMAVAQMEKLATEALAKFAVRDVKIVHRVGRIEIGESSVLIAVASAHRAAGYEASRWLIDTLKKTVPVWKKEYFEDGAVWADGDPFPDDVPTV